MLHDEQAAGGFALERDDAERGVGEDVIERVGGHVVLHAEVGQRVHLGCEQSGGEDGAELHLGEAAHDGEEGGDIPVGSSSAEDVGRAVVGACRVRLLLGGEPHGIVDELESLLGAGEHVAVEVDQVGRVDCLVEIVVAEGPAVEAIAGEFARVVVHALERVDDKVLSEEDTLLAPQQAIEHPRVQGHIHSPSENQIPRFCRLIRSPSEGCDDKVVFKVSATAANWQKIIDEFYPPHLLKASLMRPGTPRPVPMDLGAPKEEAKMIMVL